MKHLIVCLALLVSSGTAIAEVRPEYSGAWFNPAQSGHGFSIDVISPERSLAFWYAYDPFGAPIFLYAEGVNVGNQIRAQVYFLHGMIWGEFNPDTNNMLEWGTLTITFNNCGNATLQYDSILEYESGEAYGSGEMPLVHLASIDGFRCSDFPLVGFYSGTAHSNVDGSTIAGYGLVSEQADLHFISEEGVFVRGTVTLNGGETGSLSASGLSAVIAGQNLYLGTFTGSGGYAPDIVRTSYNVTASGDRGIIELHKMNRITNTSVTLADVSGNWSAYNYLTGLSQNIIIKSDGAFSVNDAFGCHYEGRFTIPNPELSILDVVAEVSGCGIAGTYIGNGVYTRAGYFFDHDSLLMAGWSNEGGPAVLGMARN